MCAEPAAYCAKPVVAIDLVALGLGVDLAVYLNLGGVVKSVLDSVSGLLGGLLGGGGSGGRRPSPVPAHVEHQYRPLCGKSFAGHLGGTTVSAADYTDCLGQCERDAVQLSVAIGDLRDCLGVTLNWGLRVDNCLYFLGGGQDVLDVDIDVLADDEECDSFPRA